MSSQHHLAKLEKIRRHGALVIAAIAGEADLEKVAATFGMVDPQEILVAKYEADRIVKNAERELRQRFKPLLDKFESLDRDIMKIEIADRNRRTGIVSIFDKAAKRNQTTDLGIAAQDAMIRHRDEI